MQSGDKAAFDVIFRHFYAPLCSYAGQFVESGQEDIVQDLMLHLWEERNKLNISKLDTYLFTATKNQCLTLINRGQIRQKVLSNIQKRMIDQFDTPNIYLIEELTKNLESALNSLPPSYKEAFILHRFYDNSYKEIAKMLGISAKTVDYRIGQALKRLRVLLKDYLPLLIGII